MELVAHLNLGESSDYVIKALYKYIIFCQTPAYILILIPFVFV